MSGLSASQSAHTGLAPVCAPFVPKGLFYVNRSVYLFSLNHFNAFICWVELKRILDCHKRSGIIPAICHSFFHCCHCRIYRSVKLVNTETFKFPLHPYLRNWNAGAASIVRFTAGFFVSRKYRTSVPTLKE